jgi:GT2 family glycosyltransferase
MALLISVLLSSVAYLYNSCKQGEELGWRRWAGRLLGSVALMDPQPSAPPVVAVVVTCDPGPWLEDALSALARQDYPNLSVLVIDAASTDDPTPRVAAVLPTAYVRRLGERAGFGRAANEVLTVVEGASLLLFCHDDVAPAANAVRVMVEEAFRSNAGIICPKLVEWDHPDHLLSVGQSSDKFGVPSDLLERGELDQEQHDAVRDVFCAPGGCTLVRADLFASLGGYDAGIDLFGEDLNLSWRAQLAGARVLVVPEARVRHLEALANGQREGWRGRSAPGRADALAEEHRIRTVLTCYSVIHLIRVLPQSLLLTVAQAVVEFLTGRRRAAAATMEAWPRTLKKAGELWSARRSVQSHRTVRDTEVRRLQSRGSARVRTFFRVRFARDRIAAGSPPTARAESLRSAPWQLPTATWAIVVVVLLIGTRGLLGRPLPGVGSLPVLTGGPDRWWRLWLSGWRPDGLGSAAPAPPALALLSLAGTLVFGAVGLLQHLLVLAPLILGPLGAYRAARPWGSMRGRAAALIVYAAVPVPYDALAGGRWAGLVLYAAAPWLLAGVMRGSGDAPFHAGGWSFARVAGVGLLVSITAALVPATLAVVPLVGLGLLAGSMLTGRIMAGLRTMAIVLVATAEAVVLLLPWSADVLGSRTALFGVTLGPAHRLGLGTVLRSQTGPIGGPLTWGIVVAAALPLLIGRSWRLVWATRLWAVALACWGVAWAASRGSLPIPLPTPEVLLAPAAAALAGAVALGAVAFEVDLPGYRFGWRQLASTIAAAAVVVGSLPVLAAAAGGRWHLPGRELADSLGFLADGRSEGPFRVLWVGDPQNLPLGAWSMNDGVGYATSENGMPDVTNEWPSRSSGATPLLAADLRLARASQTTRLGHLLAPLAVRYVVVPNRRAPTNSTASPRPETADLVTALGLQVDLRTVQTDEALTVYENAAWAPERAVLSDAAATASHSAAPQAAQDAPLAPAKPALVNGGPDHFTGPLPAGRQVLVSATDDHRWQLSASGRGAERRVAFGWAMAFTVPGGGGPASLRFRTPASRALVLAVETLLWLVVIAGAFVTRRRLSAEAPPAAGADIGPRRPTRPLIPEPALVSVRRLRRAVDPVRIDPSDEDWV